ncbi:DUF1015 domain-containing protein [bacterium]|nr:DUF1015 domain-containing protein [bacterium]
MAVLHPFRAIRPKTEHAAQIACVPYDVINTQEARALAEGKPLSFLHIIRPEIDLEEGIDEHDDRVYLKGASNLADYIKGPHSIQEADPSLYVYRLVMDGRKQTGIFGCVSVADYDNDVILKHELTRPVKEDDRTRHIIEQRAHAEPIMLTFRDNEEVSASITETMRSAWLYDFVAEDGIQHTIWKVANTHKLESAFEDVPQLYVADGHHRCKAASRAAAELGKTASDEVNYFPAVLFPMGDMKILPYNRVIKQIPQGAAAFLEQLQKRYAVRTVSKATPSQAGDICLYLGGQWHCMTLPESESEVVTDNLDVGRLTEFILQPLLEITDPRTDKNIDFVGGIRGTRELETIVNEGKVELAISMYPTSIQELVDVSDAGLLMPPKSTWFEPKLRSGFLVHTF